MQGKNVACIEKENQVLHLKEIRPLQTTFAREASAVKDKAEDPAQQTLPACIRSAPPVVAEARPGSTSWANNVDNAEGFPPPADNPNVSDNDTPLDPLYLIPLVGLRVAPDNLAPVAAQASFSFASLLSWTA